MNLMTTTTSATPPQALESQRVLFVDDDQYIRDIFRKQLEAKGYRVDLAGSAEEAMSRARDYPYGAIATDLRMPGLDGLGLIERLRRECPETSCILVTGDPNLELPDDQWLDESLVSVIVKPWDSTELLATVSRALQITGERTKLTRPGQSASRLLVVGEAGVGEADEVGALLECQGDVTNVPDIATAGQTLRRGEYEAIFVDITGTQSSRLEAVRQLRRFAPDVPLIVLAESADEQTAIEAVRLGAQDYLVKQGLDGDGLRRALRYSIERKRSENELSFLANHDPLTGLGNRTAFRTQLNHALARGRREKTGFSVLFIDLDRLKSVNDGLGHHAGDALLREVADRLQAALREPDSVARLGGDEFGVLLAGVVDEVDVRAVANRLAESVKAPLFLAGEIFEVTCSVGAAIYPHHASSVDGLLRAADQAMYDAKRLGRNTVSISGGAKRPVARFLVEREMRHALEHEEFVLHYQPMYSLEQDRVVGAEALLRWQQGDGLVPPGEFLPCLEDSDLIHEAGAWILDTASAQLRRWLDSGSICQNLAVNLSPRQFDGELLVDMVRGCLERYALPPQSLELEITETVLMKDTLRTSEILTELKSLGVRVAVDDFGTGFSSLSYLHRFPVDTLKVDRSFVGELDDSPDAATLVRSIIALGHQLGLDIVAEGVETLSQLEFLRAEQCELVQGFLLARPCATESFDELVASGEVSRRSGAAGKERRIGEVGPQAGIL